MYPLTEVRVCAHAISRRCVICFTRSPNTLCCKRRAYIG
jgi:hypothetical protein